MAPLLLRERAAMLSGLTPACPGIERAETRRRFVTKEEDTLRFFEERSKKVWRGAEAGALC